MNTNKTIECWQIAKVIIADITFAPNESVDVIREVIDIELDKYPYFYPETLEKRGITILEWEEFTKEIKTMPIEELSSFIAWIEFIPLEENVKMLEAKGVPINPDVIYKDSGWKGWKDWVEGQESEAVIYTRKSTSDKSILN